MAKLSPKAEKNAARISKSSLLYWLDMATDKLLARATNSQFEKSEIHKKLTSYKYMRWVFVLSQ